MIKDSYDFTNNSNTMLYGTLALAGSIVFAMVFCCNKVKDIFNCGKVEDQAAEAQKLANQHAQEQARRRALEQCNYEQHASAYEQYAAQERRDQEQRAAQEQRAYEQRIAQEQQMRSRSSSVQVPATAQASIVERMKLQGGIPTANANLAAAGFTSLAQGTQSRLAHYGMSGGSQGNSR